MLARAFPLICLSHQELEQSGIIALHCLSLFSEAVARNIKAGTSEFHSYRKIRFGPNTQMHAFQDQVFRDCSALCAPKFLPYPEARRAKRGKMQIIPTQIRPAQLSSVSGVFVSFSGLLKNSVFKGKDGNDGRRRRENKLSLILSRLMEGRESPETKSRLPCLPACLPACLSSCLPFSLASRVVRVRSTSQ